MIGAYSLGKAQRVIALLRNAGYGRTVYLHGAVEAITRYYASRMDLGELALVRDADRDALAGAVVICPPVALNDRWSRRLGDPVTAFASGWMRVRARARQRGVELPLVISDHADWDGLTAVIAATGAPEIWVTHGADDALVHWCRTRGLAARPLHMVGYGDEDAEAEATEAASAETGSAGSEPPREPSEAPAPGEPLS
jgi:putative mRNA 3-end processing factor